MPLHCPARCELASRPAAQPLPAQALGPPLFPPRPNRRQVDEWERDGVVQRWAGPVGTLQDGAFEPDASGAVRYVARRGMRSLATHLAGRASRALKAERGGSGRAIDLDGVWGS